MPEHETEFRDKVIDGLARLDAQYSSIIGRLDKINGNINTLYQRTDALSHELDVHPVQCEMRGRVETVERMIHEAAARAGAASIILKSASPLLWAVLAMVGLLILFQAREILQVKGAK
jgi:hypothetical protein